MSLSRKDVFTALLALFLCVTAMPHVAGAVGNAADVFCGMQYCYPGKCVPSPKDPKCIPCAAITCTDMTSGFSTKGQCVNSVPGVCKAVSTSGKDGFGLDQVAKILGDLFGKLMQSGQQSGQQNNPTPTIPTQAPTCTIGSAIITSGGSTTRARLEWQAYLYGGGQGSATISPHIGTVGPSGSQEITITQVTTFTMTVSDAGGVGTCSTTVFDLGGNNDQLCGIFGCDNESETDGASLSASPRSGTPPLRVVFTGTVKKEGTYEINFGDDSPVFRQTFDEGKCIDGTNFAMCGRSLDALEHTYTKAGTFTAFIRSVDAEVSCAGIGCDALDTVTITAASAAATTTPTTTSTTTQQVPVFSNPAFLLPGVRGDIATIQTGGLVTAGFRDPAKNTEISGFYGTYTFNVQPQGIVGRLCESRPWAAGFISLIVPATFFDSLCVARGHQVGPRPKPQGAGTTNAPVVTSTQTPAQPIPKPTTPTAPRPATSTAPAVNASVRIWAVPSAVPLGSRTSVFWTSQGVESCLVTSPDGSFTQTSLSGGASTVPITAATTYSISCLTASGAPVTGHTTVTISI